MENTTTVNIPENYDMNNGLPPAPPAAPVAEFTDFPDEIFECLPPLLATACSRFARQNEKELFLVSAMAVLSGMMPNVQGMYFGRQVMPNLYCFVIGRYGTGKGAMMWARDIGEATEAYREEQAKQNRKAHNEANMLFLRQQKLYDKGKLQTAPEAPPAPKSLKLFLPANSSKTGLLQLLQENDGRGIMFETEGDTLADMLRQKYGDFSDVLRKAFHHEPVSYYRRTDNEDVKINNPALSVVISGTPDQLRHLIPSIDNGLFSRFMFYVLQGEAPFHNPWDVDNADMVVFFNALSAHYCAMYKLLEAREQPLQFMLQPHQEQMFVSMFDASKTELRMVGDDLEGTINRLGLICYRMAMILTIIRFPNLKDTDTITCLDMDFNNAMLLSQHLLGYSLYIYEQLKPKHITANNFVRRDINKEQSIRACCEAYHMGNTYDKIALMVLGKVTGASTVYRWVKEHCKNKTD